VEDEPHDGTDDERLDDDEGERDTDAGQLREEQARVAGIEQATVVGPGQAGHGEEAGEDAADDTTDTVAPEGIERVIVANLPLEHRDREVADGAHDEAHEQRSPGLHETGGRGDHDETGDQTRAGADEGRLAVAQLLDEHPADHGSGGSHGGVEQGEAGDAIGGELGTGVEAEPAEPQETGAQHDERGVVRTIGHQTVAAATAKEQAEHETGDAGADMDDIAAGEVEGADHIADEGTLTTPHHVREGRVDQQQPGGDERDHRTELHAPGERTGDDGHGDDREHHLEGDVDDGGIRVRARRRAGDGGRGRPGEEELVEPADDGIGAIAAVGDGPAGDHPQDADDADRGDGHEHGVHRVLTPRETPIEERQAWCHEEHQGRADEHESGTARIHLHQLPLCRLEPSRHT